MPTSPRVLRLVQLLCFLGFSILPAAVLAGGSAIRGRVIDPAGAVVAGAEVIVTSRSEVVARAASDAAGGFAITGLEPRRYELHVVREGFRAVPVEVDLANGDVPDVTLRLQVSAVAEAVVVSASQVDLPLSRTPATTTVVDRQEIEGFQLSTVGDVLRRVPGLNVAQNGVEGAVTSLFSRGGESDFTAVAIDGIPVNAFGGSFDFGQLTTGDVDRIEVVHGPQSALWSGAAIGGIVNIITTPDARRAFEASSSAGTRGVDRLSAAAIVPAGPWRLSVGGERQTSNGLNGRLFPGGRVTNDDWRAEHASLGVRRDDAFRVAVNARFDRSERGFPGPYGSDPGGTYSGIDTVSRGTNRTRLVGLSASRAFSRVRPSGEVSFYRLGSDFVSAYGPSESSSRRVSARGQADVLLASAISLTAGAEWLQERATSTYITGSGSAPAPVERRVSALFGELRYDAGRAFMTAGARVESIRREPLEADPNPFSPREALPADTVTAVTPRLSASWFIRPANGGGDWTRLRASAGLGIRPPDAFEIAFSDNPGLKPERTRSGEVGIEQALWRARVLVDATLFYNRYDDLIVTVGTLLSNVSRYKSDNISNARTRGLELSASARSAAGLSVRVGYTFLDSEVLAIDRLGIAPPPFTVGEPLLRRPRHQGWAEASWSGSLADLFLAAGARGRTLDVDPSFGAFGGLYPTRGFATVAAGGAWHATRTVQVFARVINLFDRQYEEVLGFPATPRSAYAGVRVSVR